jgi:hypothetical protein
MASMKFDGLFNKDKLLTYHKSLKSVLYKAATKGLKDSFIMIKEKISNDVRNNFKIKQKNFDKAVRNLIYSSNKAKFPGMLVLSKANWMQAFEDGATISGKKGYLIVPLTKDRINRKTFKKILDNLHQQKNLYFQKRGGKEIVFAKNIKDSDRFLTKFKQLERTNRGGVRSLKRGTLIPVGVVVKNVQLKKRFNLKKIINQSMPIIVKNIENNINFNEI